MLAYILQYVYTSFLRYWMKWFFRHATGRCELQRICSGYKTGATKTTKAEYSLQSSKSKVLRNALTANREDLLQCVDHIMQEKNIVPQKDPLFKNSLHVCLLQITGYNQLYVSVEGLRKEVFTSDNPEHEAMLLKVCNLFSTFYMLQKHIESICFQLWDMLMPTVKLESRITKQWGDIGFQGDDPKTDFRGMGLLGLINLLFFSENYTEEARQVLSHANHPKLGYSYAIVGINLTEMAYSLLKSGALKPHFYNTVMGSPEVQHFHQLYCYLAYQFDKFWLEEEPESIMLFNEYREKFLNNIQLHLKDPGVCLALRMEN